jgi:hypothetical protein
MSYYGYGNNSTTYTSSAYGNYNKRVTIPSAPIDPEKLFQKTLNNFKSCLTRYHDTTEFPLLGSLLLMDQEVKVGDFVIATARIDKGTLNGAMQCTLNEPITLTHAFEAKGYLPIAGSSFKIIKRKKKTPEQFRQIAYMSVNQAYGPYYNNMASSDFEDITVLDGLAFDDNGMATINLPECDDAYTYHVVVNAQASSESNLQRLDESYSELIVKCTNLLETQWGTKQRAAWQAFAAQGSQVDFTQAFKAFFAGLRDKILELYETAKKIVQWVTSENLDAMLAYIGKKGVDKMKELYESGKKEIADTLVILSDEMLMFICAHALYSYFCLLTPQQIADFAGGAAGELVMMLLLYIVLPGAVAKLALDGLDNLAGINPAKN